MPADDAPPTHVITVLIFEGDVGSVLQAIDRAVPGDGSVAVLLERYDEARHG